MKGTILSRLNLSNRNLENSDFSNGNLSECNLTQCNLTDCNLNGCLLTKAILTDIIPPHQLTCAWCGVTGTVRYYKFSQNNDRKNTEYCCYGIYGFCDNHKEKSY